MTLSEILLYVSLEVNAYLLHSIAKWKPWQHSAVMMDVAKDAALLTGLMKAEMDKAVTELEYLNNKCTLLEKHLEDTKALNQRTVMLNDRIINELARLMAASRVDYNVLEPPTDTAKDTTA